MLKKFFITMYGSCLKPEGFDTITRVYLKWMQDYVLFAKICNISKLCFVKGMYIRVLQINLIMSESRVSRQSLESSQLPRKEEWAIIYQHQAQELERAKSLEKLLSQEKKDNLKRQLDQQLSRKHSTGEAERQEDRKYYQHVVRMAQEQREREERDKFQRYLKQKQMAEQNQILMSSKTKDEIQPIYKLEIGLKSEQEKKQRSEAIWKDVVTTLDQQLQRKEEDRRRQRQEEIQQFQKNEAYQEQHQVGQGKQTRKYEQNQAVYNYYRELHQQKIRKERQLEQKFVNEPQQRREEAEAKRRETSQLEKERKNIQMKDTLEMQLQLLQHRRNQQKNGNPQQSYSFISSIFREKKAPFDKQQYCSFLEKQAAEQRLNKHQQHYMSEEEYRLNANQLTKAISGSYTFDKYHDRSINTLGNKLGTSGLAEPLQGDDAELVKTKLQTLRTNRARSMMHSQSQMDALML